MRYVPRGRGPNQQVSLPCPLVSLLPLLAESTEQLSCHVSVCVCVCALLVPLGPELCPRNCHFRLHESPRSKVSSIQLATVFKNNLLLTPHIRLLTPHLLHTSPRTVQRLSQRPSS